ncbi:amino acid adenylation domain-containing protein [Flexibacterium corallicola]|uniref:amino acid adenylation domain-containing protein n=1 Tax=Flexibacterium corallicola TaxID=3037259 RepID=UPI00286F374D|nr:amino acid adenylation domain-containing protein [Pseudovibrio sp. M1P-2-3]
MALPDVQGKTVQTNYEAPRSPVEWQVAATFSQLLQVEAVGRADHFFALGGHSLNAVQLVGRLEALSGKRVTVRDIFEAPTVLALARRMEEAPALNEWVPLVPVKRFRIMPVSYQQERLWFLDRLDPQAGAAYHIEHAFQLEGDLDVSAFEQALHKLLQHHEALRTVFSYTENDRLSQEIAPEPLAGYFRLEEGEGMTAESLATQVRDLLGRPFDLMAGPLFRATLIKKTPQAYILVIGGHHSILDGWSVGILWRELFVLYRQACGGAPVALPALTVQYPDYAVWQRQVLSEGRLEAVVEWWREELSGVPEAITLPFDHPRPKTMDYQGSVVTFTVPEELNSKLKQMGQSHSATLFMVLETVFAVLLARLGAGRDVVVASPEAGRYRPELEGLIGFFVNTLTLRNRVDLTSSFEEHLQRTREVVLSAFAHAQIPFEAVVQALEPVRSMQHAPVAQVAFILQNTPEVEFEPHLGEVEISGFTQAPPPAAKFELAFECVETDGGLEGNVFYATQVFDQQTVERIAAQYCRLLQQVVQAPQACLYDHSLLGEDEFEHLLHGFNDTHVSYPEDQTVVELFEAQARLRPDAVAVVDGEHQLSYGELDAASNRLARYLICQGVGPEQVVGVCLERSAQLIITLLAIWKAGGAYLPLDPDYPPERLAFMLKDARVRVVFTQCSVMKVSALGEKAGGGHLVVLDDVDVRQELLAFNGKTPTLDGQLNASSFSSFAYVIYTSGSTGTPKGVMVCHKGLSNRLAWMQEMVPLGPEDVLLQKTPYTFDVSVWELFWGVTCGARVVILAPNAHRQVDLVCQAIVDNGVSVIHFVPSLFEPYVASLEAGEELESLTSLQTIFTSGEALSATCVRRFHAVVAKAGKEAELINLYGPTEATIEVLCYPTTGSETVIPIGAPVANTQAYVVDPWGQPVPIGVSGELLIGGVQVSRGYLRRSGLTAEKFIADPFSGKAGARLYRTGDLARWRSDGTLEFLGRMDTQVKIRGMRVELGEIEAALQAQAGIVQAVVVARSFEGTSREDVSLVAYVVPQGRTEDLVACALDHSVESDGETDHQAMYILRLESVLDAAQVRSGLASTLPGHMIPSQFVGLSCLPLTPSGKVDRKGLPDVAGTTVQVGFVAPRTQHEELICQIMRDVVAHDRRSLERVGLDDNFFEIGGHSIFAAQLALRLEKALGMHVPVRLVFESPSARQLATRLEERFDKPLPAVEPVDRKAPISASFEQERMWLANARFEGQPVYNEGLPLILRGAVDTQALRQAVQGVLERYEVLRTRLVSRDTRLWQEIDPPESLQNVFEDWSQEGQPLEALQERVSLPQRSGPRL